MGWFKRLIGKEKIDERPQDEIIARLTRFDKSELDVEPFSVEEASNSEIARRILRMLVNGEFTQIESESSMFFLSNKDECISVFKADKLDSKISGVEVGRVILRCGFFSISAKPCDWRDQMSPLLDRRLQAIYLLSSQKKRQEEEKERTEDVLKGKDRILNLVGALD